MPVFSQAITLADYAKQSNDPVIMKITMSLLETMSILDDLPLVTNSALSVKGRRITNSDLPQTGWGRLNKTPASIKTTTKEYEEQASLIREIIQVDRKLLAQKNWIDDPFQVQIDGAMKSHMFSMNYSFFNNDPSDPINGNPDAWIGVRTRLRNPTQFGVEPSLRINCNGVDLTTAMTQATVNTFFEYVARALAFLGSTDGRDCTGYTNWLTKERWERAIRIQGASSGFKTTMDDWGRQIDKWRQMNVKDIGFNVGLMLDGITPKPILPYTDDANGNDAGNSNFTSIVIVRYGDNYMKGWQDSPLKPEYLGRSTEYGVYENVLIDWAAGLVYPNTRSFVELYNIKMS